MRFWKFYAWLFTILLLFVFFHASSGQKKYWVFFKDKSGVEFNPYEYFDQETITRRKKLGIPLTQYTDLPVNKEYLEQTTNITSQPISISRWLNAALIKCTSEELKDLKRLNFIKQVRHVRERSLEVNYDTALSSNNENILHDQLARMGDSLFISNGYTGEGIRIAVFDAGFSEANTNPYFDHIFKDNRIAGTYDFVNDKPVSYTYSSHGTQVLSCIAGKYKNRRIGLATGAEFLLARTERVLTEKKAEEENWFEAMEWADKHGADIISSSLGYTYHRYFKQEMNGKTSLVSKAADIAASKGMLVVVSMGNEGANRWQVLATPADADSVLSVGGISPKTGVHISFSSFGPTSDKRLKPEVSAFGQVVAAGKDQLATAQGTSFSAPLITGFAACAWEKYSHWGPMKLKHEIMKSADLYPYFDYAHGYGVPQSAYFFGNKTRAKNDTLRSFSLGITIDKDNIILSAPPDSVNKINSNYSKLFYHIEHPGDYLQKFGVASLEQGNKLRIINKPAYAGSTFRVFFLGRIFEKQIP
jgi:subtilisin family serine protease